MNLAARSVPEPNRAGLIAKAKDYDNQIKAQKKALRKAETTYERDELMGGFKVSTIWKKDV